MIKAVNDGRQGVVRMAWRAVRVVAHCKSGRLVLQSPTAAGEGEGPSAGRVRRSATSLGPSSGPRMRLPNGYAVPLK